MGGGGGGTGLGETGAKQYRAKTVPDSTNLSFHMSGMIADHRRNLGSMRREHSNTPDLSATIPTDQGCLGFPVFISQVSLGRSGNSEIPDRQSSGILPTYEN